MDILDIIIAKKKSFTGETEKLTRQANEAMAKANEVAAKIDQAQEALDAAEEANTRAQEAAEAFDLLENDIDAAIESKVQEAVSSIETDGVSEVDVIDDNTSSAKIKKVRTRKKGILQAYEVMKNYFTTGSNEDGSMTQKAITQALQNQKTELENKINNIPSGGGSGSGNISGNISAEDEGSIVIVDENGNITPSTITEADIITTQIISGTYHNEDIIGLEIDYVNRSFKRLQGAIGKTNGTDFDTYTMLGGRKRCIVNEDGSIERFLNDNDTLEAVENKRIMVYQPPVYYLRVPTSTTKTANGIKIDKEQIFISDKKYAGFKIHPIFKDQNNETVKYVLLPAYESGTLRASGEFEKDDAQNINFETDKLVSIVNTKPISGETQNFTYAAAEQMAENNGLGWSITDLRFESLHQMLMAIEYGSLNIQNAFNPGITQISSSFSGNISCNSGSTHTLGNTSGQAEETIQIINGVTNTYNTSGKCAISYRGVENPYGNIWRFIGGVKFEQGVVSYYDDNIDFVVPSTTGWISAFGYDEFFDWVYLPIEIGGTATNALPVGDYVHSTTAAGVMSGLAGGLCNSQDNSGLFYYGFNIALDNYHYRSDSARIMYIPTAGSTIETNSYNLWQLTNGR